jgi:hypothetical protein
MGQSAINSNAMKQKSGRVGRVFPKYGAVASEGFGSFYWSSANSTTYCGLEHNYFTKKQLV